MADSRAWSPAGTEPMPPIDGRGPPDADECGLGPVTAQCGQAGHARPRPAAPRLVAMERTYLGTAEPLMEQGVLPDWLDDVFAGCAVYDSSSSPQARVVLLDADGGYYLKRSAPGTLEREAAMDRYFHDAGLAPEVIAYRGDDADDWLLTRRAPGEDCCSRRYLDEPERLCDLLARLLTELHAHEHDGCPVTDHTARYLARAEANRRMGACDASFYTRWYGDASPDDIWSVVERHSDALMTDTLLHGDYCLPNVVLDDWRFSGFIDLDSAGVGDRHVDVFWALWTLEYNLHTDRFRRRFIDAYGRNRIDDDMVRVVAAMECFG